MTIGNALMLATFLPVRNVEYVTGESRELAVGPAQFAEGLSSLLTSQKPSDVTASRTGDGALTSTPGTSVDLRVPAIWFSVETGRDDPPAEISFSIAGAHNALAGYEVDATADADRVEDAFTSTLTAKVLEPGIKTDFIWIPSISPSKAEYFPASMHFKFDGSTAGAHTTIATTVSGSPSSAIIRQYLLVPGSRQWTRFMRLLATPQYLARARQGLARA